MNVTEVRNGVVTLEFKMSWENSWRDSYNWDAAWIILKYRLANDPAKVWRPLKLQKDGNTVDSDFSCRINITKTDTTGVLVHRSVRGNGTSEVTCSFKWPLPAGLTGMVKEDFDDSKVFFLVQGMEMVYVPHGPYYLGDNQSKSTFKRGSNQIIPAEEDMMNTTSGYTFATQPSHHPSSNPAGPADHVNNSIWPTSPGNFAHISSTQHGNVAGVNNYWIVDFKTKKTIRTFGVSGASNFIANSPGSTWYLLGSNDNAIWDTLWGGGKEYFSNSAISYPVQNSMQVQKPGAYRYYAVYVPRVAAGTNGILIANVSMSEKDLFRNVATFLPHDPAQIKVIPPEKDIIDLKSGYTYSTFLSCYKNTKPSAAANRVNNSIWSDTCSTITHVSRVDHGAAAAINNIWTVDFKMKKTVRTFGVSGASSGGSNTYIPDTIWYFQGSNDNAIWDTLWSGGPEFYSTEIISYPVQHGIRVTKPGTYRYYRIFVPRVSNGTGLLLANVAMSEDDLFSTENMAYLVEGEDKIALGNGVAQLRADDGATWTGELPAAYPKGYKGFYVMKYEVSQEQYVRFLNALTLAQQQSLIPNLTTFRKGEFIFGDKATPTNRNGIIVSIPSDGTLPVVFDHNLNKNNVYGEDGDGKCLACNFMSINDMLAYCSWAGLRPMSELEYEKACRRPYPDLPVKGEFAWNNATLPAKVATVANGGSRSESTTAGNANYGNGMTDLGPVRCGLFATPSSIQAAAGSTFWGVMEMSGNLGELCVNVKHKVFNGSLQGKGNFDLALWGTAPANFGLRGGGFTSNAAALGISDRSTDSLTHLTARANSVGFRGVLCPDTNWVEINAGTITAEKLLVCSGDPLTLTGTAATLSGGAALPFVYIWYVKTDFRNYELIPDEMGANLEYRDLINKGALKSEYTFKRKALCALGEAVSNEVTVEVVNPQIRLSIDTIKVGVCGAVLRVEASAMTGVPVHFSWLYNGSEIDTGRVYRPDFSVLGYHAGLCKRVICKGNIGGCSQNADVVVDYSRIEALPTSRFDVADCGRKVWDERDGQCYTTVNIPGMSGRPDQCWFANNLNIGTVVPGTNYSTHTVAGIQKICYGNDEANCDKYGGLYTWDETVNGEKAGAVKYMAGLSGPVQGICPDGWHIPSDNEFKALEMNLGMSQAEADATDDRGTQGTQLKMPGVFEGINWCSGADCNKSGFGVLPSGWRHNSSGAFGSLNNYAYIWLSTPNGNNAWRRGFSKGNALVNRNYESKTYGFSVRCIKNIEVASTAVTMENCGKVLVKDDRETVPQYYITVKIPGMDGRPDQCWFANNMNVGNRVAGTDYSTHTVAGIQKLCYNNSLEDCAKYGGLYRWEETVYGEKANAVKYVSGNSGDVQGICPDGWHIPSDSEFKSLEMNLGMTQAQADLVGLRGTNQGVQIKVANTFGNVNWCNGVDCNKSGFNGLPGGYRHDSNGTFVFFSFNSCWWSSTAYSATQSWYRYLGNTNAGVYRPSYHKSSGLSVRCLKN